MDYTFSLQVQHQLTVFPNHLFQGYSLEWQMKSTDEDQGLFTDSYCKVCSAQLISESQRVAHYESRKHANKVRLYYMLHPLDGGCPAKKLRTDNGSEEGDVDKNKCCTLCNMSFTSAVVAQSHYQGKIHAKRLKLLLGQQPAVTAQGFSQLMPCTLIIVGYFREGRPEKDISLVLPFIGWCIPTQEPPATQCWKDVRTAVTIQGENIEWVL
ncbi:zinc finger matrin-type protein 4 isoform X2 [Brienomyrus brachyistius]|uniref:zinc finger matrin-type protein 4 isoform X2 n=1 Tax=Brienomyrus brachyistius TaxID=42636 RepID=UPI0020B2A0DE|nr:zinc finger matrin-type protein 4 isoform X2 [Brienomyrus brachyistius]